MTDTTVRAQSVLRAPSAWLPLALSAAASALLIGYLATGPHEPTMVVEHGIARADEGPAARVWQLLMLLQVPAIGWFALRWLPRQPKQAAIVLGCHGLAFVAAALPVVLLEM